MRTATVSFLIVVIAGFCQLEASDQDIILENRKFESENHRYVVVVREHSGLGDFEKAHFEPLEDAIPEESEFPPEVWTAFEDNIESANPGLLEDLDLSPDRFTREQWGIELAIYERIKGEKRELRATIVAPGVADLLVSNDGLFFLELSSGSGCIQSPYVNSVRVFDGQGLRSTIDIDEILTPSDLRWLMGPATATFLFEGDHPSSFLITLRSERTGVQGVVSVDIWNGQRQGEIVDVLPPSYHVQMDITLDGRAWAAEHKGLPRPAYPKLAQRARVSGVVIVDFEVDAAGRVVSTNVAKSLPFGLAEAVEDAVRNWEFGPQSPDGSPGGSSGSARITFGLFDGVRSE